jgi:hypothetical protein
MTRLIGRAAAMADLAERRRLIEKRNQLAHAVRLMIPPGVKREPTRRERLDSLPINAPDRSADSIDFCRFDSTRKFTAGRWSR